jgi:hypothetical protein
MNFPFFYFRIFQKGCKDTSVFETTKLFSKKVFHVKFGKKSYKSLYWSGFQKNNYLKILNELPSKAGAKIRSFILNKQAISEKKSKYFIDALLSGNYNQLFLDLICFVQIHFSFP